MLFLLAQPFVLLVVAVSLVVGVLAHVLAQVAAARAIRDPQPQAMGRWSVNPRRHLDAFGVIAMVIAGIGWAKPVPFTEPRFRGARHRFALAVLSGPAANLLLGFVAVLALRLVGDLPSGFGDAVTEFETAASSLEVALGVFASTQVALGVLTLIPLPPLDGARILWVYAPPTPGWQQARYQLEERNIGVAICLGLTLPIFGSTGLLLRVVYAVAGPLLDVMRSAVGL